MSAPQAEAERDGEAEAEARAALTLRLRSQGIRSIAVLRAMETVPRDAFLDAQAAPYAALDIALPIGCGQTMAEPSFVARQLEALGCTPDCSVLEVGSGSGYVTVLLGRLAGVVSGVERYRALAEAAAQRVAARDGARVAVAWADGLDAAAGNPFDRILLHVAVPAPPAALLERLAPGGIMVCPLTADDGRQDLVRLVREREGSITATRLCAGRLQAAMSGRSLTL